MATLSTRSSESLRALQEEEDNDGGEGKDDDDDENAPIDMTMFNMEELVG